MFRLFDTVVLGRDLPEYGQRCGELGAVVDMHLIPVPELRRTG
jgi:hypothetical protein